MKEKRCGNCNSFVVCWQANKGVEPTEVCKNWDLNFREYTELFTTKELITLTNKEKEAYINSIYK